MNKTGHFIHTFGIFTPEVETFDKYAKQVQIFFKVNGVKSDQMTLTFLASCGAELFNLITDLVSPEDPETMELEIIIAKLEAHYKPRSNIILSRYLFHERVQGASESIH